MMPRHATTRCHAVARNTRSQPLAESKRALMRREENAAQYESTTRARDAMLPRGVASSAMIYRYGWQQKEERRRRVDGTSASLMFADATM